MPVSFLKAFLSHKRRYHRIVVKILGSESDDLKFRMQADHTRQSYMTLGVISDSPPKPQSLHLENGDDRVVLASLGGGGRIVKIK